jgi:hypothetical protein
MSRILGFGLVGLVVAFSLVLWIQVALLLVSALALLLVVIGQVVPVSRRKFFFGRQPEDEEVKAVPRALEIAFEQARFVLLLSCVSYFFFGVVLALTLPKSLTAQMDTESEYYYALYGFTYLSMVPGALAYRFLAERIFLLKSEAISAQYSFRGASRYYWFRIGNDEYGGTDCTQDTDPLPFVFYSRKNPDRCFSPYQLAFHKLRITLLDSV